MKAHVIVKCVGCGHEDRVPADEGQRTCHCGDVMLFKHPYA